MNDINITAVVLSTPSNTHYELSKLFLEAGKDVFVEKPITLDVPAMEVAQQFRKLDIQTQMGWSDNREACIGEDGCEKQENREGYQANFHSYSCFP